MELKNEATALTPERIEKLKAHLENNAFAQICGIKVAEMRYDYVKMTAEVRPELLNPLGRVHGGMLYTMADGVVSMLARADGHAYVTLDSSFQYLCNTTEPGTLEARAELIRRGHKVSVIRVEITHRESGRLLATGTFTCCRITPSAEGTR